ncbi:Na+/H+ antiporter subunit E [Haematobacter missouriensis]|uniref:Na+/H+ antiporter subunit E n=1 Tax=Haematobacter missouriensis TaxID=366616 RepID=UPI001E3B7F9A|nr:Na+/H+ antiporter subunit E [Haematobacter missouriensis]
MIRRYIPYPLLALMLTLMWLILTRFSLGNLVLGLVVALVASQVMVRLQPSKPRIRRWSVIPKMFGILGWDIIKSNWSVAWAIISNKKRNPHLVEIPLEMRDPTALALLAITITATPGTAWVEYRTQDGRLLLHVFDEEEEGYWRRVVKNRYEAMLMEVFE